MEQLRSIKDVKIGKVYKIEPEGHTRSTTIVGKVISIVKEQMGGYIFYLENGDFIFNNGFWSNFLSWYKTK